MSKIKTLIEMIGDTNDPFLAQLIYATYIDSSQSVEFIGKNLRFCVFKFPKENIFFTITEVKAHMHKECDKILELIDKYRLLK